MKKFFWVLALCFAVSIRVDSQIITTIAGTGVAGIAGDGGPATAAQLEACTCIEFDGHGNLYIGDVNAHVIHKIDAVTGIITVFAGMLDSMGYSGDYGPATAAKLKDPCFMAFDKVGDLFFSDEGNNVIRMVDTNGIITTFAGTGLTGSAGDGGAATLATFEQVAGIAFDDSDNLYLVDGNAYKVRKIDYGTNIIHTLVGNGVAGFMGDGGAASAAELNFPIDIYFDKKGNYYIADYQNYRVRKVDISTGIITTVVGMGAWAYSGDGVPATTAPLTPHCMILDSY